MPFEQLLAFSFPLLQCAQCAASTGNEHTRPGAIATEHTGSSARRRNVTPEELVSLPYERWCPCPTNNSWSSNHLLQHDNHKHHALTLTGPICEDASLSLTLQKIKTRKSASRAALIALSEQCQDPICSRICPAHKKIQKLSRYFRYALHLRLVPGEALKPQKLHVSPTPPSCFPLATARASPPRPVAHLPLSWALPVDGQGGAQPAAGDGGGDVQTDVLELQQQKK